MAWRFVEHDDKPIANTMAETTAAFFIMFISMLVRT
jgi:hypothetical protein